MSADGNSHDLVLQTTNRNIERRELLAAGQAANRAVADYLFADYRQRRAESTLRTQRAALVLWVQYLTEAGPGADWAPGNLDERSDMHVYESTAPGQAMVRRFNPNAAIRTRAEPSQP